MTRNCKGAVVIAKEWIAEKEETIERLREALEPFAEAHRAMSEPNRIIDPYEHITLHDLRVAEEALNNSPTKEET